MKKYILVVSLFTGSAIYAQVPEDALRYSFFPQNGTARNQAIGGAMGSLGGDITAPYVNPAGLGFYKTKEIVFSAGFLLNENKTTFRDNNSIKTNAGVTVGTGGLIFGFSSTKKQGISNAISFTLTQTANFNNHIQYKGLNNYSSFSEQFAEEFAKSGYSINEVLSTNSPLPFSSAPALFTYLIDTVKINGVYQVKAAPEYILDAGQALRQEMDQRTKGGIHELSMSFAHNRKDKWLYGLSISIPYINYSNLTNFKESDTSSNTSNYFNHFEYTDDYKTTGSGFIARLGVIYRPVDYIRLGLAVHTPTWMFLTEKRTTTLSTQLENPVASFNTSSATFTNNQPGENKYTQVTPMKVMLSASYVFREVSDVKKQRAFITADVEYVHYKGFRFTNDNKNPTANDKAYYSALNNVVKAEYKGAFNYRVGGELKFNTIMARLGFAWYGNPYKDAAFKASKMLLSGGLGYRNKGMFIDLTYVHSISKDVNFPYRLADRANTFATVKQQKGNVMLTVGFKF